MGGIDERVNGAQVLAATNARACLADGQGELGVGGRGAEHFGVR